jgi:putative lipase involved disintegration of autophagic bodies
MLVLSGVIAFVERVVMLDSVLVAVRAVFAGVADLGDLGVVFVTGASGGGAIAALAGVVTVAVRAAARPPVGAVVPQRFVVCGFG